MVVRTTKGLNALATAYTRVLDDVSHRRRTNEGNSVDARVDQDVLNAAAITREHIEDTVGKSGLFVKFCGKKRRGRRGRRRLEDEGVPRGDRQRVHPHRHHSREIEWTNARNDANRLTGRMNVDSGGNIVRIFTLEGNVDCRCEVKGLPTTLNLADGIGVVLAMLFDDESCHLVLVVEDELTHPEHDGHTLRQRIARPLLLRLASHLDSVVQILLGRLQELCNYLASCRVLNGDRSQRGSLVVLTANPLLDGLHAR